MLALRVQIPQVMDMYSNLDAIVLATGDADLSHVCFKLREKNKYVVGVMPDSPLSRIVKNSVDRLRVIGKKKKGRRRMIELKEALELLERALDLVDGETNVRADRLKARMTALDPGFSAEDLGYKRRNPSKGVWKNPFRQFLEASGLCEIYSLDDPYTIYVRKIEVDDDDDALDEEEEEDEDEEPLPWWALPSTRTNYVGRLRLSALVAESGRRPRGAAS